MLSAGDGSFGKATCKELGEVSAGVIPFKNKKKKPNNKKSVVEDKSGDLGSRRFNI